MEWTRKRGIQRTTILLLIVVGALSHAQDKPGPPSPFRPGGDGIGSPSCLYCPAPQYPEEARKAKFQGIVTVSAVIGTDGHATNIKVLGRPGLGLDEKAIAAVAGWRFKPAPGPDGKPIAVITSVHVHFNLPKQAPAPK